MSSAMSSSFERCCLLLTALGGAICLSPLFFLNIQKFGDAAVNYHQPATNLYFIIIIPAADLLLDFPAHCFSYFSSDPKKNRTPQKASVVTRLTDFERALFILGVAIQTIVSSNPSKEPLSDAFIIESSVNNCSIFLTLGPIIIFLNRCTKTFTWLRTFSILFTGFIGLSFYTVSYYCLSQEKNKSYLAIFWVGDVTVTACGLILLLTILRSVVSYLQEKWKCPVANQIFRRLCLSTKIHQDETLEDDSFNTGDNDRELYSNYIPALHMLSLFVMGMANVYWKYTRQNDEGESLKIRIYINLASQIMVLVIELRIRKNEIARGLVSYDLFLVV